MGHKRNGSPVNFGFDQLATLCSPGMEPKECSHHHWQILGGREVVNIWPTTGKVIIGVAGQRTYARTLPALGEFIAKNKIASPKSFEDVHRERLVDGIRYGIAVLQIEYWTLIRDGQDAKAGNLLKAIGALEEVDQS